MQTDKMIQLTAKALTRVRWHDYEQSFSHPDMPEDTWQWYYAEEGFYVIRHKHTGSYCFIEARSPADAFTKLKRRYTQQNGKEE